MAPMAAIFHRRLRLLGGGAAEIEYSRPGGQFRPAIVLPRYLQMFTGAMLIGSRSRRSALRPPMPTAIGEAYAPARSGRTEAPGANLPPRRIHLIKCVFGRHYYWESSPRCPNTEVFSITPDAYIGVMYFEGGSFI